MTVLIIFGSKSDEKVFNEITKTLRKLKADFDLKVSSAHKSPDDVQKILETDYRVIIAGAGLAAHLPGVVAAQVIRPVIGVPCRGNYEGLDALLSIAQMPPGVPVLSVGVDKGARAATYAAMMLKHYEHVTLIGDQKSKPMKKAIEILAEFEVPHKFSQSADANAVNIEFTYFDEPPQEKDALVIYCPLLLEHDDKAEAALNFLKHSTHGLWVGQNNGVNAALAAIEILNIDNSYEEKLLAYRRSMAAKIKKDNLGL